jgi:hypothetical protein
MEPAKQQQTNQKEILQGNENAFFEINAFRGKR